MIKNIIVFLKQAKTLKKLLKNYRSKNISTLYWYDININKLVSLRGVLKVILFNVFSNKQDDIASNYGMKNLYYGDSVGDGFDTSGATVWNCTNLPDIPWIVNDDVCQYLEKNAKELINEFKTNIDQIVTHPDNESLTNENGEWSGLFLYQAGGVRNQDLENLFPKTLEIVEKLRINKNFGFVLISKISAGTKIIPHCGSSNLRHRYHLGLEVPEPDKCKIRVGRNWMHWKQGKAFGFDDSFEHEVIHEGKKDRIVLVVDLWNNFLSDEDVRLLSNPVFQTFGKVRTA